MSIDGKKKQFNADFDKVNLVPSYDYIAMTGNGRPFVVSITLGVNCRAAEELLLGKAEYGAYCRASLIIGGDGNIMWSGIEVVPTKKSIYSDI